MNTAGHNKGKMYNVNLLNKGCFKFNNTLITEALHLDVFWHKVSLKSMAFTLKSHFWKNCIFNAISEQKYPLLKQYDYCKMRI